MIDTLESNYLGWSSQITPVIAGQHEYPEHKEELHNSFCQMNPEIAKHFARVIFMSDNRENLSGVSVPVQIIQGNPDVTTPVEVGKFMHETLQNSVYSQIEGPGHIPHLTNPAVTIRAIKQHL